MRIRDLRLRNCQTSNRRSLRLVNRINLSEKPVQGSDACLKEGSVTFVTTQPEDLSGAAGNLAGLGDAMAARNTAAATPTTSLAPAASDMVSAMTAAQFGQHGATYQQIAGQAAAVHEQLVATLRSGAGAYALTEAANAAAAD
jgi:hypothetical protein